jgi:hypothetical protein
MAALLNKWFSFSLVTAFLITGIKSEQPAVKLANSVMRSLHPFHVSVTEINHNATDKTLEISCKLFTDDFEGVLAKNYKTKIDLINPPDKAVMDTLVKKYVLSHFSIRANGKAVKFSYIGYEHDKEAVYCYIEVTDMPVISRFDITNSIMYDYFDDQMNIMHVIVGGNRKSTRLNFPDKEAVINF